MTFNLTEGAIQDIMSGKEVDRPIFQVLGMKKIASGQGSGTADRYRLLLSDGVHSYSSAMLATQLNSKIDSQELDQHCILQLEKFLCNQIQPDRRVMILLDVSVLCVGTQVRQKIGNPSPYKPGAAPAAAAPQDAAPAQQQQQAPRQNGVGSNASNQNKGFYGQPQQARAVVNNNNTPNKPRPFNQSNVPNTPGGTPAKVHPIASLTPYQNRWTIRARVTNKSNIRTWSNSRGEGKLFSMNLLDDSGEIKATAFKEEVDRYYDMIEVNKIYYISKCQLKTADKRYSSLNNDYEMTFNHDTQVIICEDEVDLPNISFNFVGIHSLNDHTANSVIDVIGVVKTSNELSTVVGKASNKEVKKRDVTLVDENKVSVRLTLWGNDAETFDGSANPVLAVKGARLSDWGGRSLSVLTSSQTIINPDIPEGHRLRGWFDSVGHSLDYQDYQFEGGQGGGSGGYTTNWKTFAEAKAENLGQDKADYFSAKATVAHIKKENCLYQACPTAECNKKVIDLSNGMYRCEKCSKEYPNFKWRMILQMNLMDFSDQQWVTAFQDAGELILGRTAEDIGEMKTNGDDATFEQIFQEAQFKSYIFKMRAKMESYNDESRLKVIVANTSNIDFAEYNKKLIEDIESLRS